MRSMVEGQGTSRQAGGGAAKQVIAWGCPSTTPLRVAVPLPVPGRN